MKNIFFLVVAGVLLMQSPSRAACPDDARVVKTPPAPAATGTVTPTTATTVNDGSNTPVPAPTATP